MKRIFLCQTKGTITEEKLKHENNDMYRHNVRTRVWLMDIMMKHVQTSAEYNQRYMDGTKVNGVKWFITWGMVPHVLELGDELLPQLLVNDGHLQAALVRQEVPVVCWLPKKTAD